MDSSDGLLGLQAMFSWHCPPERLHPVLPFGLGARTEIGGGLASSSPHRRSAHRSMWSCGLPDTTRTSATLNTEKLSYTDAGIRKHRWRGWGGAFFTSCRGARRTYPHRPGPPAWAVAYPPSGQNSRSRVVAANFPAGSISRLSIIWRFPGVQLQRFLLSSPQACMVLPLCI